MSLVLGDGEHDTRVKKTATSISSLGYRVTVIGLAGRRLPLRTSFNGCELLRIRARSIHFIAIMAIGLLWVDQYIAGIGTNERLLVPVMIVVRVAIALVATALVLLALAWRAPRACVRVCKQWLARWFVMARKERSKAQACSDFRKMPHAVLRRPARGIQRSFTSRPNFSLRSNWLMQKLPKSLLAHSINIDLARAAMALSPDLVVCNDCNTLVAGMLLKHRYGVPIVYDSHELFLERNIGVRNRTMDRIEWGFVEEYSVRRCDAVMTVAAGIARYLEDRYAIPRVHLVRNTPPLVAPIGSDAEIRTRCNIRPSQKVALYCGAITLNRGLEELIACAPSLRNVAVVIMGPARDRSYRERLAKQASENGTLGNTIHLLEAVPTTEVHRILAGCDFTVVPTRGVCLSYQFEASNKMFASIMAGKPLVMTDHPEKRQLSHEFGVGVLVPDGDVAVLAEELDDLASDPQRLSAMSQACLRASQELNWSRDEQRLLHVIRATLSSSRGIASAGTPR